MAMPEPIVVIHCSLPYHWLEGLSWSLLELSCRFLSLMLLILSITMEEIKCFSLEQPLYIWRLLCISFYFCNLHYSSLSRCLLPILSLAPLVAPLWTFAINPIGCRSAMAGYRNIANPAKALGLPCCLLGLKAFLCCLVWWYFSSHSMRLLAHVWFAIPCNPEGGVFFLFCFFRILVELVLSLYLCNFPPTTENTYHRVIVIEWPGFKRTPMII